MKGRSLGLRAVIAAVAMAAGFSPMAGIGGTNSAHVRTVNKDAVKGDNIKPGVISENKIGSGREGYRRPKTDFSGNQRQYRKKCRQNPCRFNSKKHRSNN